jgi:hypothetical protein
MIRQNMEERQQVSCLGATAARGPGQSGYQPSAPLRTQRATCRRPSQGPVYQVGGAVQSGTTLTVQVLPSGASRRHSAASDSIRSNRCPLQQWNLRS